MRAAAEPAPIRRHPGRHRLVARERHGIVPDLVTGLIEGARRQPGAGPLAVRLHVEPQGVGAVGYGGARVQQELRHVGRARAPRAVIDGERDGHPLPRKPRHRVGTLPVRCGRTGPIPYRDRHVVDAWRHAEELLVDHALVGRELAHGAGIGSKGDLYMVMRGERGAVALKAQRMIRE